MDLAGKLIIKARLGDDVRRIPIHNEDLTYNELILMMQRVFRNTLKSTDEIVIKYADDDGDLITIFDDSDITLAIQLSRVLKLTIFCKGVAGASVPQLKNVRDELVDIRNRVNKILDSLELEPGKEKPVEEEDSTGGEPASSQSFPPAKPQETASMTASQLHDAGNAQSYNSSMFDPLTDTVKKSPSDASLSYQSGSRDQVVSPAGSATSKTSADPASDTKQQQQQNAIHSSFGPPNGDTQQNSLHHSTLQSSFGDVALGGPQPPPSSEQKNVYSSSAPQHAGYYSGTSQPVQTTAGQPKPYPTQPQQTPSAPANQYATAPYGSYQQPQNPHATQRMPSPYPQQPKTQTYGQPGVASQQMPSQGMQPSSYGYGYPTSGSSQGQYPSQTAQPQPQHTYGASPSPSAGQPYGASGAPPAATQQPYAATSTPPPASQYPPPGGPGMTPGYGQNPTNPHRLIRGAGGYRARQPGPGYQ